ncbi:Aromatic-L-amino-acid decarboxylase (AADC) (DOPA decarboxylase) (DDC) [Durusdinium trenchii]
MGARESSAMAPPKKVDGDILVKLGQQTLEAISRFTKSIPQQGVWKDVEPGQLAADFAKEPPVEPTEYGQILQKLETTIFPGALSWQHPKFMAYYPSSSSVPAILSETVIASIGSVGLQWKSNPIGTELEVVVMDWVAQFLGIGPAFHHTSGVGGGIIQNTAGEAMLNIMICARTRMHRRLQPDLSWEDAFHQDSSSFVVYISDQAHFSVEKACRLAGLRCRRVAARLEGNFSLQPSDVKEAMEKDRAAGLKPVALVLTYGSTNTSGTDDIAAFKDFAQEDDLWIHVDAAYAGAAWSLDEFKKDSQAVSEVVTSVNMNGSKWFLCGFDSAFLWVRDRQLLLDVFSASGVYMADAGELSIYNPEFKDWSVPLGRRFRALRIWMVFEYFGTSGIRSYIQQAIDQANWLRERIEEEPKGLFEQPVTTKFGLVCVRCPSDEATLGLASRLSELGYGIAPSKICDRDALRIALGSTATTQAHVEQLWKDMLAFVQ